MSDKSLDQINIPAFFNKYYVREVFTIEETIALSFDIDPDKICFSTEGIHDGQEKYYLKGFQEEYYKRLEIVREAVLYDNTLHDIEQEYVLFYIQQKNRWPKLWPLKAVELCKKKLFPFSVVLEKLITDYHPLAAEDLEVKYHKLEKEYQEIKGENYKLLAHIEELNKKYFLLEKDKPNAKVFNSLGQLSMGLLELHYGEEQVKIWKDWANEGGFNKSSTQQKDLIFTKIEEDLASLNAPAIKIKRDTINKRIKENIHLLKKSN